MSDAHEIASAYRAPLARIHDEGFGFIATGAAKLLIAGLELQGFKGGRVVELACGGGISAALISRAGFAVTGFDISPQMIELARRRVPDGDFHCVSLYDAELPTDLVAVTAVGEAFNYRFDPRAGFAMMRRVIERAHAALLPGGILIFDVAQPGRGAPRMEHTMWEGEGWRVTSEVIEDLQRRRLERRITSHTGPALEDQDVELHSLELYDHEETFAMLRECGFDPATLASYASDFYFGVGHGGFYAVKV